MDNIPTNVPIDVRYLNTRPIRLIIDEDPRGMHVVDQTSGTSRPLLGEVLDAYTDDCGFPRLYIRFFDGTPWPFNPHPWEVRALVRTFENPED